MNYNEAVELVVDKMVEHYIKFDDILQEYNRRVQIMHPKLGVIGTNFKVVSNETARKFALEIINKKEPKQ